MKALNVPQILGILMGCMTLILLLRLAWTQLLGRQFLVTAPAAFLGYQTVNMIGLITQADYSGTLFQAVWPFLALLGFASFVFGALVASRTLHFRPAREVPLWRASPLVNDLRSDKSQLVIVGMAILAVVVGVVFARAVGYNTLDQSLDQYLAKGSVDRSAVSELRSAATRDGYVAAGYAVQFTAIILPALILLIYVVGRLERRVLTRLAAVLLALGDLYFTTIVGGRTYLIGAVLMGLFLLLGATSPLPKLYRKGRALGVVLILVFLGLFAFTTMLQGRSQSGPRNLLIQSTVGLYNRLGGDYSASQLRAIELLQRDAPVLGSHWLNELKTIGPRKESGPTFDERLHALLYSGNTNGNLPLDPWGSYYYNWGLPGIVVVPLIAGFLLQALNIKLLVRGGRRVSSVVLLSVAGYRSMFLIGPYSFLLGGSATLLVLYLLVRSRNRRHVEEVRPYDELQRTGRSGPSRRGLPIKYDSNSLVVGRTDVVDETRR